jgi:hypothetical protein
LEFGLSQDVRSRPEPGSPTIRRTAARNLVSGVLEHVAMQLTGHKTRAVFDRYNIVSETDLRDAAKRLNAYTAAG